MLDSLKDAGQIIAIHVFHNWSYTGSAIDAE